MYLFLYGAVRNGFEGATSITRGIGRVGPALEIETFLGLEMATSEASAIWAQKVET